MILRLQSRRDEGAVAVMVAISSLLFFGIAALVVDIGMMYERRRAVQTTADLAALAGGQELDGTTAGATLARAAALDYVENRGNLPPGGALEPGWDADGDEDNGEIVISDGNTRIRVLAPRRQVDFGFAGVFGLSSSDVNAAATVEIRSLAATLPFYVTIPETGFVCLKDGSNGQNGRALTAGVLAQPNDRARLQKVTPDGGEAGTPVTLSGTGLADVTRVLFGSAEATITGTPTDTVVTVTAPAGSGRADVVAYAGQVAIDGKPSFTYTAAPPPPPPGAEPTVTGMSPTSGTGGTPVTITGDNLKDVSAVFFGTTAGSGLSTAGSGKSLTVNAPTGTGTVTVTVTEADGSSATAPQQFSYVAAAAPTVTSIEPGSGPSEGGTAVTITGSGFASGAVVTFGGRPATGVDVVDGDTITAQAPARSDNGALVVPVVVTNTDGQSSNGTVSYTYTVDDCDGSGNFGYLDLPRSDGSNIGSRIEYNIIKGIDHELTTYPTSSLPAPDVACKQGGNTTTGAVPDEPPGVDGANCLLTQPGSSTLPNTVRGFLDGLDDLDGRLLGQDPVGSVAGRGDINVDRFESYLLEGLTADSFLTNPPTPSDSVDLVDRDILQSPRFGIVPVLNVTLEPEGGSGWYPVVDFRGVFIDSPGDERGFRTGTPDTKVTAVKAYVFDLDLLPGVLTSDEAGGSTTPYFGGPRVPVLVE